MPTPAVGNSKCSSQQQAEITVKPGSTTRVRLVNAATLVYMTVCFEKHSATVVAMDAAPVEPKTFSECVDVNTGQR
jgi:L-ascorbate oxidase